MPASSVVAAEEEAGPITVIGLDVARYGSCETVAVVRRGDVVLEMLCWRMTGLMETAERAASLAAQYQAVVQVDEVGVGAGVVDRLLAMRVAVAGINVGLAARNRERYASRRDEAYWELREEFRRGAIAIPDDSRLCHQLTLLRYGYSSRGQIQVESKECLRGRGERSPDRADALMLAFLAGMSTPVLALAGPSRSTVARRAAG